MLMIGLRSNQSVTLSLAFPCEFRDTLVSLCQQASWYINRDGTEPVVQLEVLPSKIQAF